MLDAQPPFPPPGDMDGDQQQHRPAKGAVISGKSTVVPLPKAHEDKRGAYEPEQRSLGIAAPRLLHAPPPPPQAACGPFTVAHSRPLPCSHGSGASVSARAARAGGGPATDQGIPSSIRQAPFGTFECWAVTCLLTCVPHVQPLSPNLPALAAGFGLVPRTLQQQRPAAPAAAAAAAPSVDDKVCGQEWGVRVCTSGMHISDSSRHHFHYAAGLLTCSVSLAAICLQVNAFLAELANL